jgi:polyphosphate glucokinase
MRKRLRSISHSRVNEARLILTKELIMKFLVVDVGESRVKVLTTGQEALQEFASGPSLAAEEIVSGVLYAAGAGNSIWYRSATRVRFSGASRRRLTRTLGPGWVGFDFKAAFGCLIKVINDVEMQALGSCV